MSSDESPIKHWQSTVPSQRVEIGLVQVDIAYHGKLYSAYSDQEMECVKELVRNSFHAIAELRGGRLFCWGPDGGAFLFPIEDDDSFNNCCLSAIQMLEM